MKEFLTIKKNDSNGQKYINLPSDTVFKEGQEVKISDPRHDLEKNTDLEYTEIDKLISDLEQVADDLGMKARKKGELVAATVAETASKLATTARIQHRRDNDVDYSPMPNCTYDDCTQDQTQGTKYCFDHREPRLRS